MKKIALIFSLITGTATLTAQAETKVVGKHEEMAAPVTLDELKKIVDTKSAVIFDCNGADMYKAGHIPGALSFAQLEGKMASVLPKDKNALIVAYCGGTMCSAWEGAAGEAKLQGYTNIKHYKGGITGWKEAKLPIEVGAAKRS
jgi:rhodanese-related sulfurtransferase